MVGDFVGDKIPVTQSEDNMECDKHTKGTIILSDGTEGCYGCYLEQFDYCPLCGRHWEVHPTDDIDCRKEVI